MKRLAILSIVCALFYGEAICQPQNITEIDHLMNLFSPEPGTREAAFEFVEQGWSPSYLMPVLEVAYLHKNPEISDRLIQLISRKTGRYYGVDFNKWHQWIWNRDIANIDHYADFKARLYVHLDKKFYKYFAGRYENDIRLDEIRWGGVVQDGIPPLRSPVMTKADEVQYLADTDIVFGVAINGDVRAYPKRILAWHELFTDQVGGLEVAGVYCTLCGSMILYNTTVDGTNYRLGTSGFLYRSNKLMYDEATQSLWSTLLGEPVVGPLTGRGILLESLSVVTTTWGEWKSRHPETTVLSLHTGYARDYREGIAYGDYFATDELMFATPFKNRKLRNKQEVLALRFPQNPALPLAISTRFLDKNPIFHEQLGNIQFVVITDPSGANRVYETDGTKFTFFDGQNLLQDENGVSWRLEEGQLVSSTGKVLDKLPYHRAFWFGWYAAFPHTQLIK